MLSLHATVVHRLLRTCEQDSLSQEPPSVSIWFFLPQPGAVAPGDIDRVASFQVQCFWPISPDGPSVAAGRLTTLGDPLPDPRSDSPSLMRPPVLCLRLSFSAWRIERVPRRPINLGQRTLLPFGDPFV